MNHNLRCTLICTLLVLSTCTTSSFAQTTSSLGEKKVRMKNPTRGKPLIAGGLSLIIPGLGQLYNGKKQYWKIPVMIGGIGLLALAVDFYWKRYEWFYKGVSVYNEFGPEGIDKVNQQVRIYFLAKDIESMQRARDFYTSQRDFWLLLTGISWLINVLDAMVFAHFREFSLSDDLSLHIRPYVPSPHEIMAGTSYGGVSLTLNF